MAQQTQRAEPSPGGRLQGAQPPLARPLLRGGLRARACSGPTGPGLAPSDLCDTEVRHGSRVGTEEVGTMRVKGLSWVRVPWQHPERGRGATDNRVLPGA